MSRKYGEQIAVNNISFEIGKGIVGFLGPNGAGKSTTMKMLTTYVPPTSGTASVCGFDIEKNILEVRKHVGYLPESNPLYYDMYVREYLNFAAGVHQLSNVKSKVDAVIGMTGPSRYCGSSDTTRTVHVGEPTDEERKVHDIVRQAQQTAFEAVRPGVACQEIDRAARRVITDAGYGEHFIHRVGHGIGLTTHEPPYMVEGETHLIEPGMCFSIEPGIYLPGRFGVRIEDIVVATEDGGRRLNHTDHGMRIVS